MVTRQAGRDAVSTLITDYNVTQLRACRVLSFPLSTYRYKTLRQEDESLLEMIKQMAEDKKRYGMPRIHALLLRKGTRINHKRTERLYYKVLKLSLRRNKPRKRYKSETRSPLAAATGKNQIWSMDFVSDQLHSGRRVRGLTLIDVFHRESLVLDFDTSITGGHVVRDLEMASAIHGYPAAITIDNGPEFICLALDHWAYEHNVKLSFSRPGKPTDNPFIESFNGKLRDEFLNCHWFTSLSDLRIKAAQWQKEYNEERPHSSLGMLTPKEYLEKIS